MGKLFGTDGIRGVVGENLTADMAFRVGQAVGTVLMEDKGSRPTVVIGKDTRISSDMLESAVAAGLCSVGADAVLVGVVPTPAVAYLVRRYGMDAGIMLSASHNPYEYNGIKIFGPQGFKLRDEEEAAIFLALSIRESILGLWVLMLEKLYFALKPRALPAGTWAGWSGWKTPTPTMWPTWLPPCQAASRACGSRWTAPTAAPAPQRRSCLPNWGPKR